MTSGPITLWTGKEGQITVPEGDTVRSSNTDIVSVEKNGTAVTLTGGSKEGRAEVTAGESTWVVYNYASEAEYNYLYALFHGKTISVMGDSISTIKDKIPSGNALYYDNTTGKEMTLSAITGVISLPAMARQRALMRRGVEAPSVLKLLLWQARIESTSLTIMARRM